ncbi:hypothetical protein KQJ29_14845, partial [Enterococcus sp. S181_ASV_20]|nr:hypothetical protein [Enterococcus sp. S181_ASV_20]
QLRRQRQMCIRDSKYRYQSVEGFSRAFRDWSGYLPSEVIKSHQQKTFPRYSFYIDVKASYELVK